MKKNHWWVGILLVAVIAGGVWLYKRRLPVPSGPVSPAVENRTQGPADAPVTIEEFSDFQCPACRAAQSVLKDLMQEYSGKIRLTFRHFPLSGHAWSPLAHQAAECAAEGNRFWAYHDRLFETQPDWSKPVNPAQTFLLFARDAGLALEPFVACLKQDSIWKRVMRDKQEGEQLHVQSTPTFFVNHQRVVGGMELRTKGDALIRETLGLPPRPPSSRQEPPAGHP